MIVYFKHDGRIFAGELLVKAVPAKKIKKPGSRGGQYYIDKQGVVRYGARPLSKKGSGGNKRQENLFSSDTDLTAKRTGSDFLKMRSEKKVDKNKPKKQLNLFGGGSKQEPKKTPVQDVPKVEKPESKTKEPWEMTRAEFTGRRKLTNDEISKLEINMKASPREYFLDGKPVDRSIITGEYFLRTKISKLAEHIKVIDQALSDGKPVPESVLADYPDLKEKYGEKKTPIADTAKKITEAVEPKPKENPYLTMQISVVKKHANRGVLAAKEALKARQGGQKPKLKTNDSNKKSKIYGIARDVLNGKFETDYKLLNEFQQKTRDAGIDVVENYEGSGDSKKNILDIVADENLKNTTSEKLQSKLKSHNNKIKTAREKYNERAKKGRTRGAGAGGFGRDLDRFDTLIQSLRNDIKRIENELNKRDKKEPVATEPKEVSKKINSATPENRTEIQKSLFGTPEPIESIAEEKTEYNFRVPEKRISVLIRGNQVNCDDYRGVIPSKIGLVPQKDILTNSRPSWIPAMQEDHFKSNKYKPVFFKNKENEYVLITGKEKACVVSSDVLAATWDYYLKRAKENEKLKTEEYNKKYGINRKVKPIRTMAKNKMSYEQFYWLIADLSKDKRQVWSAYNLWSDELNQKMDDLQIQMEDDSSSFSKGRETSYGDSNTKDVLLKSHGVMVKRQNGDEISNEEVKQISDALNGVFEIFGNRKSMAQNFGLKISHSGEVLQHARKAAGIYFPHYRAIGVTAKYGDSGFGFVLSHEWAHFMDNYLGNKQGKYHFASDEYGSIANKIADTFRKNMRKEQKSKYQTRTCECFARAFEQYFSIKTNDTESLSSWDSGNHPENKVFIEKVQPLIEDFLKQNDSLLKSIVF